MWFLLEKFSSTYLTIIRQINYNITIYKNRRDKYPYKYVMFKITPSLKIIFIIQSLNSNLTHSSAITMSDVLNNQLH